ALAELQVELGVLPRGDALPLDAGLHPADLLDLLNGHRPGEVGVDDGHEGGRHLGVAGNGPGPQERLALPGLAPPLVVGPVAREAADDVALPTLGAQTNIHVVAPGVRGGPV